MKLLKKLGMFLHARKLMSLLDEAIGIIDQENSLEEVQEAIKCIKLLADGGFTPAMETLGLVYSLDDKEWYDKEKALEFWTKAAELNDIEAMFDMGMFYYNGRKDASEDPVSGKYWMQKSADAGHPLAIKFLLLKYS